MLPSDLKAANFDGYPPQARKLIVSFLDSLHPLPLSYLALLLREVVEYDYKFPAERKTLEKELANLKALSPSETKDWFDSFSKIQLTPELENSDWVNSPAVFVEQLSAHLWTTHQLDAFRQAATDYAARLQKANPPEPPAVARLGISVIGQGVDVHNEPLFRKLRPHGVYFPRVKTENGLALLLKAVAARAAAHPAPFAHWYVDGGKPAECDAAITRVSYYGLAPVRSALLRKIQSEVERPGMGPEALRTLMAKMNPTDLGMDKDADPVLARFQLKLFTEGSGTQIFSTTFAQWAAREALRRAQPLTLMVRFAPRQRQQPMNMLLSGNAGPGELDPVGSLVDADMAAYYNWLNQERLPGAGQSAFLAWFEGHNQALVVAPSMPRGTESSTAADLGELISWIT